MCGQGGQAAGVERRSMEQEIRELEKEDRKEKCENVGAAYKHFRIFFIKNISLFSIPNRLH